MPRSRCQCLPLRSSALGVLFLALVAAAVPARGQTCDDPVSVLVYDHFAENKDVAFPPQHLAAGDEIKVQIENTCESAFTYATKRVEAAAARAPGPPDAPAACPVQGKSVSVCIRHEEQYGAYLVQISQKAGLSPSAVLDGVMKDLSSVTLTIPVVHNPWHFDFTSGFTVSELTDPIFAGDSQTDMAGMEVTRVVRDRSAEDDRNLGVAAFTHVTHERWGSPRWGYVGPTMGLGIDERNEASYYGGLSWLLGDVAGLLGDRAALTVGYQWGSIARLPAGVSEGDPIDDVNTLADLPTRVDRNWFFSFSFSFLGGRERFDKKVAEAGTQSGPQTKAETEDESEEAEEAEDAEEAEETEEAEEAEDDGDGGATHPLPPTVEGLTVSRADGEVELTWEEVDGATYQVLRGTECDLLFPQADVEEEARFEEKDPDATVTYHYAVRAVIDGVPGNTSACVEAPAP